jgi:hypothetical protein
MKEIILGMLLLVVLPLKIENFPAEINLEIERENSLLKVYLKCYNPTSEPISFKVGLNMVKNGAEGKATILQKQNIKILPKEKIKPTIGVIKINPQDIYLIEVKIWNKEGNLIFEKTITSENLV